MAREYMCAYHSLLETAKRLNDAEFGRLMRAAISYSASGEVPTLSGRELMMWDMVKWQVDRDMEKYSAFVEKQAENGRKGGRPKKPNETQETQAFSGKPKKANAKAKAKEKEKAKTIFTPPTPSEVEAYCKQRGNSVDAKRFWEYYDAAHWHDRDGNPVRNWKQKMISVWEKTSQEGGTKDAAERDYTSAPEGIRLIL